jgi:glycosyltransferase involved in cell wall biosynthesis
MQQQTPLISLVSMVRNEEGVLERMITSVKDIVDEFIIVDTGSTDHTREIIAKYGIVHEIPFVNYVDTKNKCINLATGKYVLFMDADEVLYRGGQFIREWAEGGNVEALVCKITEGPSSDYSVDNLAYDRIRLWRNDGKWSFSGPGVHEALVGPGPTLKDMRILVRHDHSGKAPESVSPQKFLLWERLLRDALLVNPDDARALFYLGRTLQDLSRPLEAISVFSQYLSLPNNAFTDERWQAAYDMGCLYKNAGEFDKAIAFFDLAETISPVRCEHLNMKASIFYMKQDFAVAVAIYKIAASRPVPQDVQLFLNPYEYTDIAPEQLALSYFHSKQYQKAQDVYTELLKLHPHDSRLLQNLWLCRTKTRMTIFMTLGHTPEKIYGGILDEIGVGGVETTYIELARTLAELGHEIYLFCDTTSYHIHDNVRYIPYMHYDDHLHLNPDVVVTSRWPTSFDNVSGMKILWLQDASPAESSYDFSKIDHVVVSSPWHRDFIQQLSGHQLPSAKLSVISLGIDKRLFAQDVKRDDLHFVYSSQPSRGLDALADMWPSIENALPNARLSVLYGWQGPSTWDTNDKWKQHIRDHEDAIRKRFAGYNVVFPGRLKKSDVAKTMLSATALLYPNNFYETFCLTALEAQAAGAVVITSDIGALSTTVSRENNILIPGSSSSEYYQKSFIASVLALAKDKETTRLCSTHNSQNIAASLCDWSDIAKIWQTKIFEIEKK